MTLSEKKRKPKAKARVSGAGGAIGPAGPMNVDFLQQLVNLMASNDLNTVDLRDSDRRIVLKRGVAAQVFTSPGAGGSHGVAPSYVPSAAPHLPVTPVDEDAGLVAIKSPMVGTFYSSPSPDAKPFVQVGSTVDDETDVCVIEAMKVFRRAGRFRRSW